jgi:hypothetical protein
MDKDEYWLLDSVVESWDSLKCLVSEDIEGAFNKPSHGLHRDELVSVLDRLFRRGDLLAERMEKSVSKGFFVPTQTEIEEAFDGRLNCFYGLTSQGGVRWEEVSRPQWERYITASQYFDPQEVEIIGSDRQMVEKYDSLSDYSMSVSVVAGSKQWDVLEPWEATYWKVLPLGHRVRFSYEPVDLPLDRSRDLAVWEWLNEIHNWYTPYTES